MANKQGTKTVGKKSGATKKSTANLTVVEGGKGKAPGTALLLRDGKTQASPDAMRRALGVYGVEVKEGTSDDALLALLRKTLEKKLKPLPEKEKVKCTNVCGEVGTYETDFCPYCGDEGSESEEPAGAAPAAEEAPAEEAPPATEQKAPAKGKAAKTTELAKPATTADGLAVATAKLDKSMARIAELRGDIAGNSYDLGVEIRAIHEEELWKAKGHSDFKDFVEKELQISRALAYRLIEVTRQFDRKTFQEVGHRKLALIAGIEDAEARSAALDAAKAGASTKDVERHANNAKGKTPKPREGAAAEPPPKKTNPNEITLLTKVGSKPQLVGFRSASSGRPINHHKDDAYAELQLSEGVKQRIALKIDKEKNIVGITVAFVREE